MGGGGAAHCAAAWPQQIKAFAPLHPAPGAMPTALKAPMLVPNGNMDFTTSPLLVKAVLALYVPAAPFMYMNMVGNRKSAFKKGIGAQESRRKREATSVQLRKDKKEDSLQMRRRDQSGAKSLEVRQVGALPDPQHKKNLEPIPADIIALNSDEPQTQLDAATRFRKLLSIERNPPIQMVIDAGVVPRFVEFLQRDDTPWLQIEAARALTNIASGTSENTRVVMIDSGAVPIFCRLLLSPNDDVREQAVWALGNICLLYTSPSPRDRTRSRMPSSA